MAQADCHSISSLVDEKDRFINSLNSAKAIILVCVFTLQTENPCAKASATALYQAWELLGEAGAAQIALDKMRPAERTTASVRSDAADPIFKLIEDWKVAEKGHEKAVSHVAACEERGLPEDGTEMLAVKTALEEAENAASDALRKVCDTPPQTLAGLTALVKAMRPGHEAIYGGSHDYSDGRTQSLFATLETALVGLSDRARVAS